MRVATACAAAWIGRQSPNRNTRSMSRSAMWRASQSGQACIVPRQVTVRQSVLRGRNSQSPPLKSMRNTCAPARSRSRAKRAKNGPTGPCSSRTRRPAKASIPPLITPPSLPMCPSANATAALRLIKPAVASTGWQAQDWRQSGLIRRPRPMKARASTRPLRTCRGQKPRVSRSGSALARKRSRSDAIAAIACSALTGRCACGSQ